MPYKKGSLAEQAGKVRRTAKRRIERLEKEIARSSDDKERKFFRGQIDTLRKQIQGTYQRNPLTGKATGFEHDAIRMSVQNLSRSNANSKIGTSSQSRKNFLTQQEMNNAVSVTDPLQTGEFTKEEVSIFYRATQRAWEDASSTVNRNMLILEYYGEKDLRRLIRKILELNREAVEQAHRKASARYESEEDAPSDSEQRSTATSADWVTLINMMSKDTFEQISIEDLED